MGASQTPETPAYQFAITLQRLKWINAAVSTDGHRQVLTFAAIAHFDGHSWLCGTDTHRLHCIRLAKTEKHEIVLIDIRRVLHEMAFNRSKMFRFNLDGTASIGNWTTTKKSVPTGKVVPLTNTPVVKLENVTEWVADPLYAPVLAQTKLHFPNVARVIEPVWECKTTPKQYAINPKYLADAMGVASGVIIRGNGKQRPILIEANAAPDSETREMFAVVMPMAGYHELWSETTNEETQEEKE